MNGAFGQSKGQKKYNLVLRKLFKTYFKTQIIGKVKKEEK